VKEGGVEEEYLQARRSDCSLNRYRSTASARLPSAVKTTMIEI
jgi:hypothetical protein